MVGSRARTASSASRADAVERRRAGVAAPLGRREGAVDRRHLRLADHARPCAANSAVVSDRALEHEDRRSGSRPRSRMLPRLPNRVFRLITRCSRRLSIGGLVTWLKFCRK